MPEISPTQFPAARPLFASLEQTHALVAATFEANLSARIFVDDVAAPSMGVMVYTVASCAWAVPQGEIPCPIGSTLN